MGLKEVMDMNKDIEMNENETVAETETENVTETETVAETETKPEKKKTKKIRNELLFKKGGVSIVITALFIAGVIIFNILFGVLSDRLVLEYDFSTNKDNSLSADNITYIKNVKKPVKIIVCSAEDDYSSNMTTYLGMQGVDTSAQEYYDQTVKLLKKYAAYNKNIDLDFIDPNSSEFTAIEDAYKEKITNIGDIIVSSKASGKERVKALTFTDVYGFAQNDDEATSYSYSYKVTENKIENALTGAISYVVNESDKKIMLLMGHSADDYTTSYYQQMLKENNYEVVTNTDKMIQSISDDCSEIVIPVPTVDFSQDEILILSDFLENGGKYGRGLTVFASANAPYLPVFYDFLNEWGITVEEGVVFETDEDKHLEGEPATVISYDEAQSKLCVSASNVPLIASENKNGCTVTSEFVTSGSAVAVPKDTPADFKGADSYPKKDYATVISSEKTASTVSVGEDPAASHVSVFSSFYFLQSEYNENQYISNKDVTLSVTENNNGVKDSDISFVTKTIENESFAGMVSETAAKVIRLLFVFVLPLAIIGLGIFVYIKRRNAE